MQQLLGIINRRQTKVNLSKICRRFAGFIIKAFNTVDRDRLRCVGPDRLCAEWILKNGGSVLLANQTDMLSDYNELPAECCPIQIHEIDATNSTVISIGFTHLTNCKHVSRVVLDKCNKMDDAAIDKLHLIKDCLRDLQISNCPGVYDSGLRTVARLTNLKILLCFDLQNVKDLNGVVTELIAKLPECKIIVKDNAKNISQ